MTRLEKHQQSKQEGFESSLMKIKAEYEAVAEEHAIAQTKAEENEKVVREIEEKMEQLDNQEGAQLKYVLEQYGQLGKTLSSYQTALKSKIERV